jgi:hypothetical protein
VLLRRGHRAEEGGKGEGGGAGSLSRDGGCSWFRASRSGDARALGRKGSV